MKALDLYKYITENNIEWHYRDNEGEEDVLIFPFTYQIDSFIKLLTPSLFGEGIDCTLMHGYFAFWMKDICEYYGIELSEVFDRRDDN
jgi:hypothetical protein